MTSKSEREIAADNGMWLLTHLSHRRKNKKNSGLVLSGRKHTKIVRPGDVCLRIHTGKKHSQIKLQRLEKV